MKGGKLPYPGDLQIKIPFLGGGQLTSRGWRGSCCECAPSIPRSKTSCALMRPGSVFGLPTIL